MVGDVANITWDTADSYRLDKDLLEYNNCTAFTDDFTPYEHNSNKGHIRRVKRCNKDLFSGINGKDLFLDNTIFNDTTVEDIFESGLIGVFQGPKKLSYKISTPPCFPICCYSPISNAFGIL
jgi:hypothetical protein